MTRRSTSICWKAASREGEGSDQLELAWSGQESDSGVVQTTNRTSTARSRKNLATLSFPPSLVKNPKGLPHARPNDMSNTLAEKDTKQRSKGWTEQAARSSIGWESMQNQLDSRWKDDCMKAE
jgi:hypothetical protein